MKGQRGFSSGDANLVAACLTVDVPLDERNPVTVLDRDDGKSYGRFHLMPTSIDGTEDTYALMRWWSNPGQAPEHHPFSVLMDFIRRRPQGCRGPADWLDHAFAYLRQRGDCPPDAPRNLDAVVDFVRRHPEDLAGYVFAFVVNRDYLFRLYGSAGRSIWLRKGGAHTVVREDAPPHIARELIARLG